METVRGCQKGELLGIEGKKHKGQKRKLNFVEIKAESSTAGGGGLQKKGRKGSDGKKKRRPRKSPHGEREKSPALFAPGGLVFSQEKIRGT